MDNKYLRSWISFTSSDITPVFEDDLETVDEYVEIRADFKKNIFASEEVKKNDLRDFLLGSMYERQVKEKLVRDIATQLYILLDIEQEDLIKLRMLQGIPVDYIRRMAKIYRDFMEGDADDQN